MEFLDARRLTGPSLIFDGPACILDVACTPDEADMLVPVWADNVGRMLEALDWPSAEFAFVKLQGPHVMETIGQLNEDHPDIVRKG